MRSLRQVETMLLAALGNEALFGLINTRVMIRTGVDLRAISPEDDQNPELLVKVTQALTALGFPPDQLQVVAQAKLRASG